MLVKPVTHCPFCSKELISDKKRQRIFLWSDCENAMCDSQFMQYSYLTKSAAILWKFNLHLKNYSPAIKIDFHFPINKSSDCGIIGYKRNEKGISSVLFEIDSVFEPDFSNIDYLTNKIESLIMFA